VPVNATIGAEDRAGAAASAVAAREAGFRCVKVKVGIGDDAGRVAAVRAALGPHADLRLDSTTTPCATRASSPSRWRASRIAC
jgi:L-alanine-DL-glutamate epimerase-like enolase superfamily enzyme